MITFKAATSNRDWIEPAEAAVLAARIREYWAIRGYEVNTKLEHLAQGKMHGPLGVSIRSDMKNGFPVRRNKAVAA